MWSLLSIITGIIALASTASATVRGNACCSGDPGLDGCKDQQAWGCIQLEGPNCVDQTQGCDAECGFSGFAYRKHNSDDEQCVCSDQDAAQVSPSCPSAPFTPPIRGNQCCSYGLQACKDEGAWGCTLNEATYCIDQTQDCDDICGNSGFAYQKRNSGDRRCICSAEDLGRSGC